jgi:hypothetical protein
MPAHHLRFGGGDEAYATRWARAAMTSTISSM